MSFRDVLEVRGVSQGRLSPDGKRFAYVVSSLNWQQGRRWREVFVREADGRTRPVGANTGSDDTDPLFSPDGRWLGFLSDRSGAPQVYLTPASGGEPRRISDIPGGVTSFGFSGDDRSVVVLAGREDHRQLYLYEMGPGKIATLAPQIRGVSRWAWGSSPNRVYFTAPAVSDPFDQLRIEQRFDVQIADAVHPPLRLWDVNLVTGAVQQVRLQADLSIRNFTVSRSGQFLGITAAPAGRYSDERDEEAYLYDVEAGKLEKLTSNHVSESVPDISPNEEWVAFSAPEEFEPFRRSRIYLRPVRGGAMRMLPRDWDGDARGFTWSRDSKEMYFDDGVGLNEELFAVSAPGGRLRQLTERVGELHATYFENSDRLVVSFQSPAEPADYYLTTVADVAHRDRWKRLTDVNPQAREFALGEYEPVRWKSTDGQTVEGILVKPLNYKEGERYPVVVQLHGGPAGAYINNFAANWGTYVHVFAAAGYAVFQPNYRGSTNYGEKFRMEIAGDYFRKGFDDIMTGMDALIRMGIADPDRLGMMGWSAGGHWSNWALTHTDRFKAISTGAGAANWVSMYAETDAQDTREFYFGGTPYDNWNEYLDQSPLKYIRNAKTPTLIHVGEDDARVPKPQSDELYTALKKLGVPTEMVVYPRMGHNITEPRLQMAKMMLEFNWFEKYLRGRTYWLAWRDLVDTVPSEAPREMVSRDNRAARMLADRPEDKPAGAAKHSRRRGRAPARAFREPEADGNTVRPGSSARGN